MVLGEPVGIRDTPIVEAVADDTIRVNVARIVVVVVVTARRV